MVIRDLDERDWPAVAAIWAEGIATGSATFETEVPSWEEFDRTRLPGQRLVAVDGRGIGRALLDALLARADAAGIWTIQTSVFPENEASVALHERVGFRIVGRRERIAKLNGFWRDTLFLERRSPSIS